jgi:hypothetical protein
MTRNALRYASVATVLFVSHPTGAEGDIRLSTGVDYSTGKYGSSERTDMLYVPLIGKYENGPLTLKVTVPYLRITGPGNVIGADRIVISTLPPGTSIPRRTESGLGDIIGAVSYTVFQDGPSGTLVDLTGKIKFPTADANRGLGTGETDYAAQVDLYKRYTRVDAFASVGYRVMGDPPGVDFRNVWYGTVGGSSQFSATTVGIEYDYRQAVLGTSSPASELTLYGLQRLGGPLRLQVYAVKGLTNGSPDWGAGVLLMATF